MHLKILSIEIKDSGKQQNQEKIYSATAQISSDSAIFEAVLLYSPSGVFLTRGGRPLVKFRDYNKQTGRVISPGQTNYQNLIHGRIAERLGEVKTLITAYLLQNQIMDADSLRKKQPALYLAASQVQDVFSR